MTYTMVMMFDRFDRFDPMTISQLLGIINGTNRQWEGGGGD